MAAHPQRSRVAPRVVLVATITLVVLATTLVGCGGRDPQTVSIVIPAGTQQQIDAGTDVELMPSKLEFRVGDSLRIRNEDDVVHSVGPYSVRADSEFRFTYGAAGTFEGYCPLSEGDRYEIVVTE